ncbi:MAG: hypothetical protein GF393_09405 [Armatimonadia bacterium]|nr:hypothetical protein [Armatimonadia bacterium]
MHRTALTAALLALTLAPLTAQETTITGTVVGPDGEAIAGATVGVVTVFLPPFEWETGTTEKEGRFEFTVDVSTPQRMTFVAARAEGYAAGGAMSSGDGPVELKLTREMASLSGTVSDADGNPIEGARVEAMMVQGEGSGDQEIAGFFVDWEHAPSTMTDPEGHFTLDGLPEGVGAMLSVGAEGFATSRLGIPRNLPITGQDEELSYTLRPGGTIAGRVTHDGEPVADIGVRAFGEQEDSVGWGSARTDVEGRYEIESIAAGAYTVTTHGGPEDLVATPLEDVAVEAGGRTGGVDIELTAGAVVRGRVTWQDTGEPVAGVAVGSYQSMGAFSQAQTGENGTYELHLPPGEHRISLLGQHEEARSTEPSQHEVTIAPEEEREGVDFAFTRKRRIALTVLGPDGEPASGVTVHWSAHERYERPDAAEAKTTDEAGRVELLFGRQIHEWDTPLSAAVAQDPERDLAGIVLIDGNADDEATIRLQPGAWIETIAQTREGEPLEDISLRLRWQRDEASGHFPVPVTTGDDGRARVGPLPTGIALHVMPSGRHHESTLEPSHDAMPRVELEPGETRELGPFVLAPDGMTVRGTVIDAEGDPVEGAIVTSGRSVYGAEQSAETDAEGRFELTGVSVSEETVMVLAVSPDGSAAWVEPVDPAIAFEPTLQLGTPGTLVATIRGADGRPAPDLEVQMSAAGNLLLSPTESLPGDLTTHARDLRTDAEGRVRVEGLIPGLEYHVMWRAGPEDEYWQGGESVIVYGDGEVVEVDMTMGE